MTADKPTSVVPTLRFPEFQDAPGWPRRLMGCYLSESRIKGNGGDKAKKLTVKLWGKGVIEKQESVNGSVSTQYYRRRAGQFIYSKLDFLNQAFGIIPEHLDGFESTVDLPCFDIASELNSKFLLEYVQREQFYKTRGEIADGGRKAKRIQVETFLECPIYAPSGSEQQKIADCLGSLDDLIAAEGRKVEALRQHKQGLMQHLFPQPGESQPRLRFPEFRGASPWNETPLTEHFAHIRNGFVGIATPFYVDNGVPYFQGKNIKRGRIDPSNLVRISEEFHKRQAKSQLKSTDILMVQSGHVGECAVVGADYAGSNCHALIVLSQRYECCSMFFAQYFYSPHGKGQIAEVTSGNTIKHILASDVRSFQVPVPGLKERKRIGDFLSSVDLLIEGQIQVIADLTLWKKGLMQQLFPSLEVKCDEQHTVDLSIQEFDNTRAKTS